MTNPSCHSTVVLALATVFATWSSGDCFAQNTKYVADREAARRQAALPHGDAALARGKAAMTAGNFAAAHEEFRTAVSLLPDAVVSEKAHDEAVSGFCASGIKLAEQRIAEGKYAEAEAVCREMLNDRYDPNCRRAAELLAHLQVPGYFNRTMGPKFLAKVDEVKKLLSDADGYYNSGRYDLAFKKYEQVLNLDPYNVAARRGEEKINLTKTHYGEEAYNETRSRQLWHVQKAWEEPVRQFGPGATSITDAFRKDATGTARITNKLNSIIIPKIEFRDASVREAIEFLRQQAAANDPGTDGRKGVDIVLRLTTLGRPAETVTTSSTTTALAPIAPATGALPDTSVAPPPVAVPAPTVSVPSISPAEARITITLNEIPLGEALRYIASQAGLKVKIEPYAVSIIPISDQSNDLLTKEYRVPPGFISGTLNANVSSLNAPATTTGRPPANGTGKDTQETTGGRLLVNREGAKEFLENQGVSFPPGASANFLPQSSRLIVRNTADNLELVDAIVEQANVSGPKQVEIEAKFVEITQNNLKALGFDWLLGPFNLKSGGQIAANGGTSGTGAAVNQVDYPFPTNGLNPVTAGNRNGNLAITGNAIDSLLLGTTTGQVLSPGIFGIGGLLTDPQFQVVIRALNQKKGVDLLSAPRVTTKSGQRAMIEIVREFRYPTEFQPPQIPQTVGAVRADTGGLTGDLIPLGASSTVPVTPTTPTHFETRNTGVTLEVEPVVGPDGVTIDLNLVPQVVEFEGFINYGSPILAPSSSFLNTLTGGLINSPQSVLTPNVINQPIFSTRKVTTSVSVWDGQTVVLGGLMREDVQKTKDRTPLLGDIPIVGRLFRTNVDQHIKRNLIIFVTARLVNPGGQPVNSTEEVEESEDVIEPPILPEVPFYKK
jgi:general secretion pathway protein D